jgi:hypothetical protein
MRGPVDIMPRPGMECRELEDASSSSPAKRGGPDGCGWPMPPCVGRDEARGPDHAGSGSISPAKRGGPEGWRWAMPPRDDGRDVERPLCDGR